MLFRITKIVPFLVGVLIGPSFYLNIAMGDGIVPWVALDYSFLIALASIPLAYFSSNKFFEMSIWSIVIGIIFSVFTILSLFSIGFIAGLPGSEWTDAGAASANAAFIVAMMMTIRNYRVLLIIVVGFVFSFVTTITYVHMVTKSYVDYEIQETLKSGGCVVLNQYSWQRKHDQLQYVYSIDDIPFGVIIGNDSPRIKFVKRMSSSQWTYGGFKTVPSNTAFDVCLENNKPK